MQAGTVRSFGSPSVINWSGGESKARRVPINMLVKIGNEQQTALCCKGPDGARLYLVGLGVNPINLRALISWGISNSLAAVFGIVDFPWHP